MLNEIKKDYGKLLMLLNENKIMSIDMSSLQIEDMKFGELTTALMNIEDYLSLYIDYNDGLHVPNDKDSDLLALVKHTCRIQSLNQQNKALETSKEIVKIEKKCLAYVYGSSK